MDNDTEKKLIELRDYLVREVRDWRTVVREEATGAVQAEARAGALEEARNRLYELFPELRD